MYTSTLVPTYVPTLLFYNVQCIDNNKDGDDDYDNDSKREMPEEGNPLKGYRFSFSVSEKANITTCTYDVCNHT